jgi:hypothetical protein
MNELIYQLAMTRHLELLGQAADYRLPRQAAATTGAAPGVAAYRRRSRWTIPGLAATRRRALGHAVPRVGRLGGKA